MCLIIEKPAGKDIPAWVVHSAMKLNKDGVGLMTNGRAERFLKIEPNKMVQRLNKLTDKNVAVHFRMATHGQLALANVHPFKLIDGGYLMHNGVLGKYSPKDRLASPVSDTRLFISEFVNPHITEAGALVADVLAKEAWGQRLMAMRPNGELIRIGDSWVDWEGLFFSNTYAWDAPQGVGFTYGYSDDDWGAGWWKRSRRGTVYAGPALDGRAVASGKAAMPPVVATMLPRTLAPEPARTPFRSVSRLYADTTLRRMIIEDILIVEDYLNLTCMDLQSHIPVQTLQGLIEGTLSLDKVLDEADDRELLAFYRAGCAS